jgi:hypothetical protein
MKMNGCAGTSLRFATAFESGAARRGCALARDCAQLLKSDEAVWMDAGIFQWAAKEINQSNSTTS